jgi:RNA polymerase sigma-70 factor (ECF subfamily)
MSEADESCGDTPRPEHARNTAEGVARRSYGKLVALLAARTRNVSAAEEALSEAFAAALASWPRNGCPTNPEAWLLTAARRKLIDVARHDERGKLAAAQARLLDEALEDSDAERHIPDRRLALMFACAHPAIEPGIRAPLMLQLVLGLDAARIASAFLVAPSTMGQRLSRAKNKIRTAGIPFRIPERDEWPGRLGAVLDAVYAAFAEGWSDAGELDSGRRDLAEEALFLGRLVAELLPEEPEVLGLVALLLHAEARRRARRSPEGEYVPLGEQNPADWDQALIEEAESLLRRASALGAIGRYQLEAALQSAHVARRRGGRADWPAIVVLYDALLALTDSPVVALNRALAVAEVESPAAALRLLDGLSADPRLLQYQPYWVVRADLLARTGAAAQARDAYDVAMGLERDPAVRRFLQARQAALGLPKS